MEHAANIAMIEFDATRPENFNENIMPHNTESYFTNQNARLTSCMIKFLKQTLSSFLCPLSLLFSLSVSSHQSFANQNKVSTGAVKMQLERETASTSDCEKAANAGIEFEKMERISGSAAFTQISYFYKGNLYIFVHEFSGGLSTFHCFLQRGTH